MWQLLKELLKQETLLVTKYRAKGKKVIKPSSVAVAVIAVLYLLSPIDIVPEKWIHPKVFGYIDDMIILALAAMYIYSDIGGVVIGKVQSEKVQKPEKSDEPVIVPSEDRSSDHLIPVPSSIPRERNSDSLESYIRDKSILADDSDRSVGSGSKNTESDIDSIYKQFLASVHRDEGEGES